MSRAVPTIDVLREARKLVADEKTWTTLANARNGDGRAVAAHDSSAICWCASGAVIRSARALGLTEDRLVELGDRLNRIADRLHGMRLTQVNDVDGRLAALSVIDAAIAELEAA